MSNEPTPADLQKSVAELQSSYYHYMSRLKAVLDHGEIVAPYLVAALNHKHANPIAKALGLLMYSDHAASIAVPALLECLVLQSPMYPDVLEALVRFGSRCVPELAARLDRYNNSGDDEAVRNLLDLSTNLDPGDFAGVVPHIIKLVESQSPHIREAAIDALARLGLPYAKGVVQTLRQISESDPADFVRDAAKSAMQRLS